MKITEFLKDNRILLDGGTGTLLQKAGLPLGELPERWNLSHPEIVRQIHADYFNAGSHIVCTNTFGANALKYSDEELQVVIEAAVENAKAGAKLATSTQPKWIALDIGSCGKLLKPYGDLAFEDAVSLFAKTVKIGAACGVDLIFIETMGDSYETKAAVLAAKENCDLPLFVSCAYGEDGKLMTGASPAATVALLEGLGVDALGLNCSLSPQKMRPVVEELLRCASIPVLVKPNAGLPDENGEYDLDEESFASDMAEFAKKGVRVLGGCCGTTPAYIRALQRAVAKLPLTPIFDKQITCVSSYTHAVEFSAPVQIGERINPTGKKRFKQALKEKDVGYILAEGLAQMEKGAHILDVNVGAPEIEEREALPFYIQALQEVLDLPLQIDTADTAAMERAMRLYNGKPLVNSVNGKKESMASVFPLVKKYGGAVVGLTLDEGGIPDTVEGRLTIAERIIAEAKRYGISQKDILIDPLAMAVSADEKAATVTLQTVRALSKRGINTSLGVSNVSFGLPAREVVNAVFFAQALENGLSAAILNPHSAEMQKVYYAHLALHGLDSHCEGYIRFATALAPVAAVPPLQTEGLKKAIVSGVKEHAVLGVRELLSTRTPVEIVDGEIVPALDEVGRAYEEKRAYLPQLLVSAEAAKAAFEVLKEELAKRGQKGESKGKILLATVEGDIHDIGKNIVASLLENYGYTVVDLGKDVPAEKIVAAVDSQTLFVGLSALMTTTLPSMARTVTLLKERGVVTLVGGAVVSEEYAQKIGADGYAKDGMAAVRFAEKICKK